VIDKRDRRKRKIRRKYEKNRKHWQKELNSIPILGQAIAI
jgi:hypothetical protein